MKVYDTDEEKRVDVDGDGYPFENPVLEATKKTSASGKTLSARTTIQLLFPNLRTTELDGSHYFLRAKQDGIWNFLNIKEDDEDAE